MPYHFFLCNSTTWKILLIHWNNCCKGSRQSPVNRSDAISRSNQRLPCPQARNPYRRLHRYSRALPTRASRVPFGFSKPPYSRGSRPRRQAVTTPGTTAMEQSLRRERRRRPQLRVDQRSRLHNEAVPKRCPVIPCATPRCCERRSESA